MSQEVIEVTEREVEIIEIVERGPAGPAGAGLQTLTTQGDMLYQGASTGQRLPIGTAGQVLKVNSGATAPEWGTISTAPSGPAGGGLTGTYPNPSLASHTHVSANITDATSSATGNKIVVRDSSGAASFSDLTLTGPVASLGTENFITINDSGLLNNQSAADARTIIGLGNVNNTSDSNKPVSTATQTALNLKANLDSPALTGTPTAPTASAGTNTTQVATTAFTLANRGDRYLTTSTSSNLISTGSKTFVVQSGLSYTATQDITIVYDGDPTNKHMHGVVTSYSGTTLVVNVESVQGSGGPYTAWTINVGGLLTSQGALLEANNLSDVANTATALTNLGGVPTSRTISAGTGLTGGGDLTANRTLAVSYGSSAGTACEGNDPRLSDSRTPNSTLAHKSSHATGGTDALAPSDIGAAAATHAATHAAGTKANFSGMTDGLNTNVTIRANNVGTAGNSITLSFNGSDTVAEALTTWNDANPSNQATLYVGDGTQVPDNGETITLSGGTAAGSDAFSGINQNLGKTDEPSFDGLTVNGTATAGQTPNTVLRGGAWFGAGDGSSGVAIYKQTDFGGNAVSFEGVNQSVTAYNNMIFGAGLQLYLKTDGSVGIGNSDPQEVLDVSGNIALRDIANGFSATLQAQDKLSANRTYDLPNASGTLALTTDNADQFGSGAAADGYVLTADGGGGAAWEAATGGGDTVSIETTAADILSVASGAISADDAGADRIVYWNNTNNKLAYGTPSDVGAAASGPITASGLTQATARLIGRTSSGVGAPEELSATDVRSFLNVADGAEVNVNADWNASSGDAQILNKPTLGTAAAAATTDFAASNHTHAQLHDRSHAITSTSDHTAGNWKVWYSNGSGQVTELALGAANTVLTSNGASSAPSFAAAASGGTKTYAVFTAGDNQPPSTSFATLDTRNSIAVLDFDDASTESAVFVGVIPEGASLGSGLIVNLDFMATTATSGNVRWSVAFERCTTDLDSDSFDTATASTVAVASTSGIVAVGSITCTAIDSITAGDLFRLRVQRLGADAADTASGDIELVAVELRSAA